MGMYLYILFFILVSSNVEARPISYSGGSTLMMFSDNMKDSLYYHYSPSYKYSVGIENLKDKNLRDDYSYLRFTYLINRKNNLHSQRNLYFQSGLSTKSGNDLFYGIHGDWETRRWFLGFDTKKVENRLKSYNQNHIQIGFAPYLGEYGDIHTWLMLKTKKTSIKDKRSSYPALKFFKGNTLLEFGYNNKTDWDIHLMYRF
jgi:hypothetical protein